MPSAAIVNLPQPHQQVLVVNSGACAVFFQYRFTPNIVLISRTRLSLGLDMDFGSRHFRNRPTFGSTMCHDTDGES